MGKRVKRCEHTHANYKMLSRGEVVDVMGCYLVVVDYDNFGYGDSKVILSARCYDCNAVLSLGKSNDAPAEVQVEIRAAEMAVAVAQDPELHDFKPMDWNGWAAHESPIEGSLSNSEFAGWMAREINTHDDRETRDSYAWEWHIDRPIAEQDEPWMRTNDHDLMAAFGAVRLVAEPADPIGLADTSDGGPALGPDRNQTSMHEQAQRYMASTVARCSGYGEGPGQYEVYGATAATDIIAEQTRHDVAASVARHADLSAIPCGDVHSEHCPVRVAAERSEADVPSDDQAPSGGGS